MHKEVFESLAFFSQSFRKIESYEGIAWKKYFEANYSDGAFFSAASECATKWRCIDAWEEEETMVHEYACSTFSPPTQQAY